MTAIHRESRRAVQENDLGPLMGTALGKSVFQFMNFGMNHRDWSTMSTVLHGAVFAGIAYKGCTMLSAQGMDTQAHQDFLNERMSTKSIVASSVGRIAQASLLPNIYDTESPYSLFAGMQTTSDLYSMVSNPTYQAANSLISMEILVNIGLSDKVQTRQEISAHGANSRRSTTSCQ